MFQIVEECYALESEFMRAMEEDQVFLRRGHNIVQSMKSINSVNVYSV